MIPRQMVPQDDFSAGELDAEFTRSESKLAASGARQMRNFRLLNSQKPTNRPGRRALYVQNGRVDEVKILPGVTYHLCFGAGGGFLIRESSGTILVVKADGTYPWRAATVDQIVWTQVKTGATSSDVVICFPGMKPQIASFDGVVTWTIPGAIQFQRDGSDIPLVPYYRIAAPTITMSADTAAPRGGNTTVRFSAPVLLLSHVGAIFRLGGARIQIQSVVNSMTADVVALDKMFPLVNVNVTANDQANGNSFQVGQLVNGSGSGTQGVVTHISDDTVTVQTIFNVPGFRVGEVLVSTTAALNIAGTFIFNAGDPTTIWDEAMFSDARGWPQSCANDQNRLIFCDLPGVPEAVVWSGTGQPYNFSVGANPTDGMAEIVAEKPRIYHVVPTDGGEMVFTDRSVQYVPISETNPLKPGSVVFRAVSPEGAARIKPIRVTEGVLYVNAGLNRVLAAIGSGASYAVKPYAVQDVSENHTHLFTSIKALAVTLGDSQFAERYVYALNTDGSITVGKFNLDKTGMGWLPWSGAGAPNWISALQSALLLTTIYQASGNPVTVVEVADNTQYVDAGIPINAVPANIAPPSGKGPMWWAPGTSVALIDGIRNLGTHVVDANGFITLLDPSEGLSSATIIAGFAWTPTLEPFIFNPPGGEDRQQRMRRRKIVRAAVSVMNSTGFTCANRLIPPYFAGDNQTLPPPLREHTETFRPRGRAYDPRLVLTKDMPGPLTIIELGIEATI